MEYSLKGNGRQKKKVSIVFVGEYVSVGFSVCGLFCLSI